LDPFFRVDLELRFRVFLRLAIEISHPSGETGPLSALLSPPESRKSIPRAGRAIAGCRADAPGIG
jgi:hypothetical protein